MKRSFSNRNNKLIRNVLLIVLALIVLWLVLGTPALTRAQAFRRAMREHFLDPRSPEVYFGEDGRISALAKVDSDPGSGVYVQTALRRTGIAWEHGMWSETAMVNDPELAGVYSGVPSETCEGSAYIIPLFAYGEMTDSPEVAVLPNGVAAEQLSYVELIFVFDGEAHRMDLVGEQDGWYLFHFEQDVWTGTDTGFKTFVRNHEYMKIGTPEGRSGCRFIFAAYDQSGSRVMFVMKDY